MVKVIIVEDDAMVTQINRHYLAQVSGITLVGTFENGKQALSFLSSAAIDLVILDVFMPEMNGLEVLRTMRQTGIQVDVIMVTAANDTKQVEEMLRLGVVDYLVKPFTNIRFKEAMEKYLCKKRMLDAYGELDQYKIDRMLGNWSTPVETTLQKGLQKATLHRILDTLQIAPDRFHSCDDLALHSGLSKVTVRRYLNYLAECSKVECKVDYDTGGRPSVRYRFV